MTGMFVGLHAALAVRTNTPELMIEPDEGKAFMKSAANVMRHYDVRATQKTLDWIAFIGCAGSIYGTRAFAIAARRAGERQAAQDGGQVIQWPKPVRPRPEPAQEPAQAGPPAGPAPADFVPSVVGEYDGAAEFGGEAF